MTIVSTSTVPRWSNRRPAERSSPLEPSLGHRPHRSRRRPLRRRGARLQLATPVLKPPQPTARGEKPGLVLIADGCARPVAAGESLLLGSGAQADWRIDGRHVSSRHARVCHDSGGLRFQDLRSTNGSWCLGKPVTTAILQAGDVVALGRTPLIVAESCPATAATSRDGLAQAVRWRGIVAGSERSMETLNAVALAASSQAPVWVSGPSGTGKEGAAAAIHGAGARAGKPYIRLNCAALPDALAEAALFGAEQGGYTGARKRLGAFRAAHGGTLLLDEVGELSLGVQAKLLRVLETGDIQTVGSDRPHTVNVRVIASTWRDLDAEAEAGRFRFDLLQRLCALRVDIPPLSERPQDIPPLIGQFLGDLGFPGLFPDRFTLGAMRLAPWPGNVRELKNAVARATATGAWDAALWSDAPPRRRRQGSLKSLDDRRGRKQLAENAIGESAGNRANAARLLGISRSTLYRWLAQTG